MIEIEKFKRIGKGHLLAVADLSITEWRLSIKGVAIFEKAGGRWVALPQKTFQGDDGKTKYTATMAWTDKAVEARFRDAVLSALEQAGHLEPSSPPSWEDWPNQKNPQRMTYRGWNHRPEDFEGVQPPDDIPY